MFPLYFFFVVFRIIPNESDLAASAFASAAIAMFIPLETN